MVALARTVVLDWIFLFSSCAITAQAQVQHERFQAVETAALLSPRYYLPVPARPLEKRQNGCKANDHPCNDIGVVGTNLCCGNDEYCIVDPDDPGKASCCQIGSTCGSRCSESQVQCNATSTITSGGTTTTSLYAACCGRRCPETSMFGCAESLGNGCCSYGSTCAPSRKCISTVVESSSETALVSLIPDGCTTSQIKCASSLGGGCCAVTQSCVRISDGVRCAEATITPTMSGLTAVPADDDLSAGAKAGISVGVVVLAGVVIGVVTWMCIRKRRRRRSEAASSSYRPRPTDVVGALIGGGRDMSDINSDGVSRPGGGLPGVAQDYFGPEPQIGPYSDRPGEDGELSPGTTPGVAPERADRGVAVPLLPHGPSDIAAPVEIDSTAPRPSPSQPESASPVFPSGGASNNDSGPTFQPPPSHVAIDGTFELYGSDPDPSGGLSPYVPSPNTTGAQVSPAGEIPSPSPGGNVNR